MNWRNTSDRYSTLSRALHWLVVLLFVTAYATVELHEVFERGSAPRRLMMASHFMAGLSVLLLVWLRLAARLLGQTPQISPAPPKWQTGLAHAAHAALYLLMIGLPLLGWLMRNAGDSTVTYFGLTLPALIGPNEALHERLKELHGLLANLGYLLIGGHAAAALFHHYMQKDNTLRLMLPARG